MFEFLKKEFETKNVIFLKIKVRVGASKTVVKEILQDGTIKIDIADIPEKGKANKELIRFLKNEFFITTDKIKIISGAGDKNKLIKIKK